MTTILCRLIFSLAGGTNTALQSKCCRWPRIPCLRLAEGIAWRPASLRKRMRGFATLDLLFDQRVQIFRVVSSMPVIPARADLDGTRMGEFQCFRRLLKCACREPTARSRVHFKVRGQALTLPIASTVLTRRPFHMTSSRSRSPIETTSATNPVGNNGDASERLIHA